MITGAAVAAGGRGDITERLLADDDEEDLDDGTGPLAGIKRQMRMLSQEQQLEQPYEPALGQQQEQQKVRVAAACCPIAAHYMQLPFTSLLLSFACRDVLQEGCSVCT